MARRYVNPNRQDAAAWAPALPPEVVAALSKPPLAAELDGYSWARSWGAFLAAIKDKEDHSRARAEISRLMASRPRNDMGERVPSEGGFLVPERLRSQVLAYMETGIVMPRCTHVPMDSLRVPIPVLDNPDQSDGAQALGGLAFSITQEGEAIPATVPQFGRLVLEAWADKALLKSVPNELMADATSFTGDFLPRIVAQGLSWHIDDLVLYQGSGVGQPQALVNAPAAVNVTRDPPTPYNVGHKDVVAMLKALHPASKTTATWLASEDVFDQLLELYEIVGTAPDGQDISPPSVLKFKGGTWTLFGLPLIPNGHQPAAGTAGDLMLCDLGLLLLGDRGVMTAEVSQKGAGYVTDTASIRFRYRWDARFWPQQSITLANGKVTSPLVVLQ